MSKRFVYICSPCKGDILENISKATDYCRRAVTNFSDVIPIAPHVYFTKFLNDMEPTERSLGLEMGLELLDMCDELWVYGLDNPSEGMKAEIKAAGARGLTIRDGFLIENIGMSRPHGVKNIPLEELDTLPAVLLTGTRLEHYEDICAELLHSINKFTQKYIKILEKENGYIKRNPVPGL